MGAALLQCGRVRKKDSSGLVCWDATAVSAKDATHVSVKGETPVSAKGRSCNTCFVVR
jgi:hypothetical protein